MLKNIIFAIILVLILPGYAGAVTISAVPDTSYVTPGQQFNVDLILDNPANEGFAAMGVWLKYDKNLLSVVDTDAGNWITSGTNILDGPFHASFDLPGDPGLLDNVNDANTAGEIAWDARRSFMDVTDIYASGTFARITFQASDNFTSTDLAFYGDGTGGYPDTYVMNTDLAPILTSASGATINAIPEPATLTLMGAGLFGFLGFFAKKRTEKS